MIKHYYQLTKPGIIYANTLAAAAGFFLASKGHLDYLLLIAILSGTSLIVASGCVFNNYIDRSIDKFMERTKNRSLVRGEVSGRNAILYGVLLGVLGFWILAAYTNSLTVVIEALGWFFYVVMYSIFKRRSIYGTLVGSVSGAAPPVAGYCAVSNKLDSGAILLFLILVFWQVPHFYAIAIYRLNDYRRAKLSVLPVKKGVAATKIQILLYIIAFTVATFALTALGYTGYAFLIVMSVLSLAWLWLGIGGLNTTDVTRWARKMFIFSLVIILLLFITISIDVTLSKF